MFNNNRIALWVVVAIYVGIQRNKIPQTERDEFDAAIFQQFNIMMAKQAQRRSPTPASVFFESEKPALLPPEPVQSLKCKECNYSTSQKFGCFDLSSLIFD